MRSSSWFKKLPYSQPMEEEEDDCDYAFEKDRTLITKRYPVHNRKQTEFYFGTLMDSDLCFMCIYFIFKKRLR